MAGLTGKTIGSSYKSLLRISDDTDGIDTSLESVTDGEGTVSALKLSDDQFAVQPANDDTTEVFCVKTQGDSTLLAVDSTNSVVKAGLGQANVLTQYANFGISSIGSASYVANTHYTIPFATLDHGSANADVDFGTGTDPDTSFTTANTDTQYASQIVPMMWYISDAVSIDSVISIEGADAATGDTTRMHLMSFQYNHNNSSVLTGGTLLAHNSDVTNAGNEQTYRSTWTIDEANVSGGNVVLAFFRCDSVNSDYSLNITVKYHLR